jgi:hypothetical protein
MCFTIRYKFKQPFRNRISKLKYERGWRDWIFVCVSVRLNGHVRIWSAAFRKYGTTLSLFDGRGPIPTGHAPASAPPPPSFY